MKKKKISELLEFGIINLNKPSGPTSFKVSEFIKKSLNLRKTSHFGTLDPKVTGVLPIALNRACKLTGYFIGHDKEYVGIMRLHEYLERDKIQKVINKKFIGKIKQTPPVKSRVKRQERERIIKKFELIEQKEKDILFKTEVQGGTYIRKLIDDLGKELKIGAHMLELRRIRAGIFNEKKNFIDLYDFEESLKEYKEGNEQKLKKIILPAEEALKEIYPSIKIKKDNLKKILTGKPIKKEDLIKKESFKTNEIVNIFCEERFIGIYKIKNKDFFYAKPEFVMQPLK